MKIVPLLGLDIIAFGDFRNKAIELFGEPEIIQNVGGKDGIGSEVWEYKLLGLHLLFDPDYDFRLEGIYIYSSEVKLDNFYPIGLTEQELLIHYPALELEVTNGQLTDYVDNSKEILFFLRDKVVRRIVVSPNIDSYLKRFG